jgi:predicted O-methyltransferase YrrM/Skp family chaperone for outer membrane proteins
MIPRGDYVSDGLSIVVLDELFPNMIVGDKATHPWPYLRREVPHNWYCDRRYPEVGFVNRDEVMLLYNLALQFRGKPGLEIGCWMGWSSCHIALAGVQLDVIDPALARGDNETSLRQALEGAGVSNNVRLYQTASPEAVDQLARARGSGWNFFFIDGNHEAPGPEQDARVCLKYAAADALFAFHDVVSPDVEKGLAVLRDAGFRTMIYETMQIVGVAWRGNVILVDHVPDPNHNWSIPDHLLKYAIAGESQRIRSERIEGLLHLAQRELALKDAAIGEMTSRLDELARQVTARAEETARLRDEAGERERSVASLQSAIAALDRKLSDRNAALHDVTQELADRCKDVSSREARVEELQNGINSSQAEVQSLSDRIQAMKRSYSWKLTRPFRDVRKFAHRLYSQSDNTKAPDATSANEKKV